MAGGLFNNGSGPSVCDVRAFMDSSIPELIAGLLEMGVLVSIGTTRDRGAISITITADGEFDREYFRESSEAADYLRRAADALRTRFGPSAATSQPSAQRPVRRRQKLT
jgi:hypothetical protein